MLLNLPKDIQKIIWKLVFDNTIKHLKLSTCDIANVFDDSSWRGGYYDVRQIEKCGYYEYIRFKDKDWGLLIGCGKNITSFEKNS